MSKRFIDSNLFSDEWFSNLSKDGKLFFIYFITNCDHAGILRLNKKLCEFQIGTDSLATVIKELGNCLVTVKEGLLFMPKYLKFQYPDFPKSKVMQQQSALKILNSLGINWTVAKELPNSYDNDNDNDNDNVSVKGVWKKQKNPSPSLFMNLEVFEQEIKNSTEKLSAAARRNKTSVEKILEMLPDFIDTCKLKNKTSETWNEYCNYFSNWLLTEHSNKKNAFNKSSFPEKSITKLTNLITE